MKKHLKWAIKCIVFLFILCICIKYAYQIMVPKFFFNTTWPTTSTYLGFYEMEKNTIDVFFLGSSHAASSFVPQELYNNYGITSYNLGCEQQNVLTSYFWLKEGLRYQKPKIVILDCYALFSNRPEEALNSTESGTRKAIDYMQWSSVKREAVKTICELDEKQSLLSYYFPNIRYHARWTELSEEDFAFSEMSNHYELKGYVPLTAYYGKKFKPFDAKDMKEGLNMVPLMKEYLDKIVELCEQEEIQLILVKTPSTTENIEKFYTTKQYADEHNLTFLDFNEKELYEQTEFFFMENNNDIGHVNIWGAKKLTNYVGMLLTNDYGMKESTDEQWEISKEYYEGIQKDGDLTHITDIDEYLIALQDKRYSIFISTKGEYTLNLKASTIQNLKKMGLDFKLQKKHKDNYLAIISNGKVIEQMDDALLEVSGTIRNDFVMYDVISSGEKYGNVSSIMIDGEEQSKNKRGLNIVVYNNETMKVVDTVCFDTYVKANKVIR